MESTPCQSNANTDKISNNIHNIVQVQRWSNSVEICCCYNF